MDKPTDADLALWARLAVQAMLMRCLLTLGKQFTDAARRVS